MLQARSWIQKEQRNLTSVWNGTRSLRLYLHIFSSPCTVHDVASDVAFEDEHGHSSHLAILL